MRPTAKILLLRSRSRLLQSLTVALAAGSLVAGCGTIVPPEPKFIDDIRPVAPGQKATNYSIQRKDLVDALARNQENTVRLVPVTTVASSTTYEYRLFDIRPSSVYQLLGLENSDVLIAVSRYLVKRPDQFKGFVQLLATQDEASIEIRRGGEAKLFKYSFLPPLAAKGSK
jgi:type II secretory pathway component PulC